METSSRWNAHASWWTGWSHEEFPASGSSQGDAARLAPCGLATPNSSVRRTGRPNLSGSRSGWTVNRPPHSIFGNFTIFHEERTSHCCSPPSGVRGGLVGRGSVGRCALRRGDDCNRWQSATAGESVEGARHRPSHDDLAGHTLFCPVRKLGDAGIPWQAILGLVVSRETGERLLFGSALLRNAVKFVPWEFGHTLAQQAAFSGEAGFPAWVWGPATVALVGPLWWLVAMIATGRTPYDRWASARVSLSVDHEHSSATSRRAAAEPQR